MAKKTNVGNPVKVLWEDAWTNGGSWTQDEADTSKPLIMALYGYCIRDDKQGITLTMEVSEPGKYRVVWHVPRAMVRKVTILK